MAQALNISPGLRAWYCQRWLGPVSQHEYSGSVGPPRRADFLAFDASGYYATNPVSIYAREGALRPGADRDHHGPVDIRAALEIRPTAPSLLGAIGFRRLCANRDGLRLLGLSFTRNIWSTYARMTGVWDLFHWLLLAVTATAVMGSLKDWGPSSIAIWE